MNTLAATMIQTPLYWEDKAKNIALFDSLLATIQSPGDFIVLPEMFTTAFSMNRSLAEPMEGETVTWMKRQAATLQTPICGSLMIVDESNYYNRFVWVNPDGTLQFYNKRHLFRMAKEHDHFTAGNNRILVELNGWKLFPVVCYDLRFPVWLRRTAQFDYDAMIVVANWPERREQHWRILLQARAIENQSYVVAVNRVGEDGNGLNYSGYSGILSPKGEWIIALPNDASVTRVEMSREELIDWRTNFPAANDADTFTLA